VFGPAIHVERTADRTRAAKELERALAEVTGMSWEPRVSMAESLHMTFHIGKS